MDNNVPGQVIKHIPPDLAKKIAENTNQHTSKSPADNQHEGEKTKQ